MRIGIICEGKGDFYVLQHIIRSVLNVDEADIFPIRPSFDETDTAQHNMEEENYSNWTLVKKECIEKSELNKFLIIEQASLIVIQIDSAECELKNFDINRPAKNNLKEYSNELRELIICKIKKWLGDNYITPTLYAITIEETEAWLIPLYINTVTKNTVSYNKPKEILMKLEDIKDKDRLRIRNMTKSGQLHFLSQPLLKKKYLDLCRKHNFSLDKFCTDLESL